MHSILFFRSFFNLKQLLMPPKFFYNSNWASDLANDAFQCTVQDVVYSALRKKNKFRRKSSSSSSSSSSSDKKKYSKPNHYQIPNPPPPPPPGYP